MFYQKLVDLKNEKKDILNRISRSLPRIIEGGELEKMDMDDRAMISTFPMLEWVEHYKSFVINNEQVKIFSEIPLDKNLCRLENIKTPFDYIFIDFDGVLEMSGENFVGMFLSNDVSDVNNLTMLMVGKNYFSSHLDALVNSDNGFLDVKGNARYNFSIKKDTFNEEEGDFFNKLYLDIDKEMRKSINLMLNFCFYLNSANIYIEEVEPVQSKKRRNQGLPDKASYSVIKIDNKTLKAYPPSDPTGVQHSYRYDVRGHFKRFTAGKMSGKHIWCPPHQRGLKNELYKPKSYQVE